MWTTRIARNLVRNCVLQENSKILPVVNYRIKNDFCTRCTAFSCSLHTKPSTKTVEKVNPVRQVQHVNKFTQRTHTCGELTLKNVGEEVQLCGWMEFQRMGKFIILRDSYGSTQLIIPDDKKDLIKSVEKLNFETVLGVTGRVIVRPTGQENPKMKTGSIEIEVERLEVLNESLPQLPFSIRKFNNPKETLQMQYRYLALRFPFLQRNLRVRSQILNDMRFFLIEMCGFVDVETPTLFRRTPGGAQEFVVPTQHRGKFYSLVQSPQQFKQLLMIGGIDRYFQIARCYRDETARPDRQPEFTQLDIELSFTDREGIMTLVEKLIENCWPKDFEPVTIPFKRFNYEEIMEMYGSDQPDLRIPYRIHNITDLHKNSGTINEDVGIYGLSIPNGSDFLTTSVKTHFMKLNKELSDKSVSLNQIKISEDNWEEKLLKTDLDILKLKSRLNIQENDVVFIVNGARDDARKLLGKVLKEFTNVMEAKGSSIRSKNFEFSWIVDFPLFEKGDDANSLVSTHHPFTAPHPDDAHYLEDNPLKVRGLHYDLVLNGSEIAGGSIRIHNAKLQEKILNSLNIDTAQMSHLLEALRSGAPPHGGIAFGLDRLISIICDSPTIRDVIAFPKTGDGKDLMSGAPAEISEEEKILYHLKIRNDNEK
ncbi:aspartate--tRNA ligase, mitochondrial [Diachasmimorpha longicaudata]|uniref:aspartate--tRNA ligase, mitochondrial n=1 Tax=Diachasmimorpha longicaudata TaxID=58733 RepID=UPI0030B8925B